MDEMKQGEILERLARLEAEVKAAFKRIDEQKTLTESVHKLALSVERQSSELQSVSTRLSTLSQDVDEMKERPAKRWDAIVAAIISAIVGLLVGWLGRGIK